MGELTVQCIADKPRLAIQSFLVQHPVRGVGGPTRDLVNNITLVHPGGGWSYQRLGEQYNISPSWGWVDQPETW